jgi:hypothetical protein
MKKIDLRLASSFFEKIGRFANNLEYWKFCLLFTVIFVIKSGFRGIQPWGDFTPVVNFPKPEITFSSNSYGLIIISKLFNATNQQTYFILNIVLLVVSIVVLYYLIYKSFPSFKAKLLVLFFVSSPIFIVLTGNIGRHDLLTITGILGFFIVKKQSSKCLFLILGCLGSPEHIFVAFFLYYMGIKIYAHKEKEFDAKFSVLFTLLYNILSNIWISTQNGGNNRLENIILEPGFIKIGIRNFFNNVTLEWYSYFGFYWFSLIIALVFLEFKLRVKIFCLLLIPLLFTIILVDKTRDFVVAIIPLALLVHKQIFDFLLVKFKNVKSDNANIYLGLFIYLIMIFPSIEITFEGRPRAPFEWAITKLLEAFN